MVSAMPYIGSKFRLSSWIIEKFGKHNCYCEVFGGVMHVLLSKNPSQVEIFNDLDGDIVNLWRQIKNNHTEFAEALNKFPYSRQVFNEISNRWFDNDRGKDNLERAVMFWYIGMGSFAGKMQEKSGWKHSIEKNEAQRYYNRIKSFEGFCKRLQNVQIENRDFRKIINDYDSYQTLFYCDPPYVGTEDYYANDFNLQDHEDLAEKLRKIKGKFVLSYYDHPKVYELYPTDEFTYYKKTSTKNAYITKGQGMRSRIKCIELLITNNQSNLKKFL
jgi:DNA adenine methylase